jgi:hypothetical protein
VVRGGRGGDLIFGDYSATSKPPGDDPPR